KRITRHARTATTRITSPCWPCGLSICHCPWGGWTARREPAWKACLAAMNSSTSPGCMIWKRFSTGARKTRILMHFSAMTLPLNPRMRLQSLSFSQRALRKQSDAALLFDEVEDIFPGTGSQAFAQMLGLPRRDSINTLNAKAWVNRALEDNHVPTIWITNDAQIDPAYLCRFDYSVEMGIPPHSVRRQIVQKLVCDQVDDPAALRSE